MRQESVRVRPPAQETRAPSVMLAMATKFIGYVWSRLGFDRQRVIDESYANGLDTGRVRAIHIVNQHCCDNFGNLGPDIAMSLTQAINRAWPET